MKKILLSILMICTFSLQTYALTHKQRIKKIQETYSGYTEGQEMMPVDLATKGVKCVYMTGDQLTPPNLSKLNNFFHGNPEAVLIIDFKKGDNFVDESGKLTLKKAHIPQRVFTKGFKKLVISNVTGDITSIGNYFLYGCTHIEELDLNGLSKVTGLGVQFLEHCSIKRIHLEDASAVVYEGYQTSLKNPPLFQG